MSGFQHLSSSIKTKGRKAKVDEFHKSTFFLVEISFYERSSFGKYWENYVIKLE